MTAGAFFLAADDIDNVIKVAFDCRPDTIAQPLALHEPKYQETAEYYHFGREAHNCLENANWMLENLSPELR